MPFPNRFNGFLAGVYASVMLVTPVFAQADTSAQFQARYTELRAAVEAHDTAAIGKIFAPDYQMTDIRGDNHTGAEVLERMQKMAGRSADPSRKVETTVLAAMVSGDTATVEQQLVGGGKRAGDDGAEHTMELVVKSTDTWVKRGDGWVLSKSVQTGMTVKRDGEVFFQEGK
ncbi:nuclear transport factor 2 family protein [Novosphingobium sp.]|uniref:nuclear transport factor 2 family protein n=1 Tax=Novosphingobium sp. TaxID=1874826 RepID=UPI0025DCB065|nr:nuclear transport factor 2 family protein [Novosphingobium sp.]